MIRKQEREVSGLVVSGFSEIAMGALMGWPYAVAIADPDRAKSIGIRSTPRLRQFHLDLVMLGGLSVLAGSALPKLPRTVAVPLAVGCWTNALSFGVLVVRPHYKDHPIFRGAVVGSFVVTSGSFSAVARQAVKRWRGRG